MNVANGAAGASAGDRARCVCGKGVIYHAPASEPLAVVLAATYRLSCFYGFLNGQSEPLCIPSELTDRHAVTFFSTGKGKSTRSNVTQRILNQLTMSLVSDLFAGQPVNSPPVYALADGLAADPKATADLALADALSQQLLNGAGF